MIDLFGKAEHTNHGNYYQGICEDPEIKSTIFGDKQKQTNITSR